MTNSTLNNDAAFFHPMSSDDHDKAVSEVVSNLNISDINTAADTDACTSFECGDEYCENVDAHTLESRGQDDFNILNISDINNRSVDSEETTSEDWLAHLAADITATATTTPSSATNTNTSNHTSANAKGYVDFVEGEQGQLAKEPTKKEGAQEEALLENDMEGAAGRDANNNHRGDVLLGIQSDKPRQLPEETPLKIYHKDAAFTDMISPTGTIETEASTVASSTPSPRSYRSSGTPDCINNNNSTVAFEINRGSFGTTPTPFKQPDNNNNTTLITRPASPPPRNEFQKVQLRRTSRLVERHMVETQLEFAEMVANAIKRKSNSTNQQLEVLRHMDSLKQEVALLQSFDEMDDGDTGIQKLRRELIDMFNQGGALQEEYLLQWLLPLSRDRDSTTGQYIMNANQVALLQQFASASNELDMIDGLGIVKKVLQMNFKGINGAQCLQAMHDYAFMRLGKRREHEPRQDPWDALLQMVAKQSEDLDVQVRVRNALVQWVVREILGSATDEVTSKQCFHAIYLVATLKLELQRLAPQALEQAQSRACREIQAGELQQSQQSDNDNALVKVSPSRPQHAASPARPPVLERLLEGNASPTAATIDDGPLYRNPDTVDPNTEGATTNNHSSTALVTHRGMDLGEAPQSSQSMLGASCNSLVSTSTALKKRMEDEKELPVEAQDAHRVVRTILGPNHPVIHVSDCFEAIRIYSSLIMEWNEASSQSQGRLESQPSGEELALRALEPVVRFDAKEPPLQVVVRNGEDPDFELSGEEKRRRRRKERRRRKRRQKQQEHQHQLDQHPQDEHGHPLAPQLTISALMAENAALGGGGVPRAPGDDDVDVDVDAVSDKNSTSNPPPMATRPSSREKMLKVAEAQQSQVNLRQRLFSQLERRRNKRAETRRKVQAAAQANATDPLLASSMPETSQAQSKKKQAFWKKIFGPKASLPSSST